MTLIRTSPSGSIVSTPSGNVESVFGRVGDVIALSNDYQTSEINNVSSAPGLTAADTLDAIADSDAIVNESGVSGATLSDALDTLLSSQGGGSGSIVDTFCGGTAITIVVANASASVGDLGWNYITFGTDTGNICAKVSTATAPGTIGAVRVTSPTTNGAGSSIYLGSATLGLFLASSWHELTFRARPDAVQAAGEISQLGVMDIPNQQLGAGESAGFQARGAISANYQTVTSHLGAGNTPRDTGVPIDALFHDFRIVRPDAVSIEFYIDGVLRTTHRTSDGDGMPSGALLPFAGAIGGGASSIMDVDNFSLDVS